MGTLLFLAAGAACENDGRSASSEPGAVAPVVLPRARLQHTQGKVSLKRSAGDDWKDVGSGTELFPGDKLRTERGARTGIHFVDGSQVTLGEDSLIGIGESRAAPGSQFDVTVLKGRIDASLDDAAKQSLTVSTPAATVRAGREIVFQ